MKVVLSTIGKFHSFDLARQLHQREMLTAIFTGYPRFKLKSEQLPPHLIHSFSLLQMVYMARGKLGLKGRWIGDELAWHSNRLLDIYVSSRFPSCDVFLALANTGLRSGRVAQSRGATYVCDRPGSHIRYQDAILREEYAFYGLQFRVDPRIIEREEREYEQANAITVGSSFARRSFLEMGFDADKVHLVPYGVDLSRFAPVAKPDPNRLDVLFVGSVTPRKGIRYLLEGFERLQHPNKSLTIVGSRSPEVEPLLERYCATQHVTCTGHMPQPRLKEIMSRSHVMVLPSVEEGLAMVQAQAMACACPIIGTTNSGAEDLIEDGVQGFILPIRDSVALTERLQLLADTPELRLRMSRAALERVQNLGGWNDYGEKMVALFEALASTKRSKKPAGNNIISCQ